MARRLLTAGHGIAALVALLAVLQGSCAAAGPSSPKDAGLSCPGGMEYLFITPRTPEEFHREVERSDEVFVVNFYNETKIECVQMLTAWEKFALIFGKKMRLVLYSLGEPMADSMAEALGALQEGIPNWRIYYKRAAKQTQERGLSTPTPTSTSGDTPTVVAPEPARLSECAGELPDRCLPEATKAPADPSEGDGRRPSLTVAEGLAAHQEAAGAEDVDSLADEEGAGYVPGPLPRGKLSALEEENTPPPAPPRSADEAAAAENPTPRPTAPIEGDMDKVFRITSEAMDDVRRVSLQQQQRSGVADIAPPEGDSPRSDAWENGQPPRARQRLRGRAPPQQQAPSVQRIHPAEAKTGYELLLRPGEGDAFSRIRQRVSDIVKSLRVKANGFFRKATEDPPRPRPADGTPHAERSTQT